MPDAHKNFAYSLVATAPSPATSGTSLVVTAGQGALFPAVPFNATIWPAGANPLTTNAEIVRVTAISTDTLTITRAQESSSARTVIIGDQIAATITAKTLTDVETQVIDATHGGTNQTTWTQGDLLYSDGANTLSKLGAGTNGQILKTSGAGANPAWITPAVDDIALYQTLGSTIKAETYACKFYNARVAGALSDGRAEYYACYLPIAATITGVKFLQKTQGAYTADNNNYVALYSYSAGTMTRVAISANDGNLWKGAANTLQTVAFTGTYAAVPGVYYIAFLWNSSATTTVPAISRTSENAEIYRMDFTNSAVVKGYVTVQTTLPTTQTMAGLSGLEDSNYWLGIY